ncbi:hypothetical protein N9N13_07440 [Opitutales bacterium]|jgi:hypothetical protein|nr:hypothetical protein [Opitutales bacterium]
MKIKLLSSLSILSFIIFGSSCTRTANKTGPLKPYPEITNDIEIGEPVRGEGTRAELLGFIRWGDPGRASFRAHEQEHDLGGAVVKQSMQSAVYKALDGQPDHFIVDPHFHTVEHNFLIFKTAKTQVVGRKATNKNYRQVKRFNTDGTETLLLENSPQTYTVDRNGRESTKITTSGNITPFVTESARVYDTPSGVRVFDMDTPTSNNRSSSLDIGTSMRQLEAKMQELNRRISTLDK